MPPVVVHAPDSQGGRRVVARGRILGVAYNVMEVLDLLEGVGLDRADVRLDDVDLIDWRGGGSYEWTPSSG
ncbi:hypothetical protein [Streptomyces reniochalinae]|uniref:Uncharacterized protein n=1 Tax=Streptomyces reniochalinae TaxID=2250578 RepID=A0A367EVM0_9ACTN|nr:hypothetical protein [Streptomyces reniochalinae]RCG21729.1 hypothetical protein DQ392_08445 [Streptomyces reniochalinae]